MMKKSLVLFFALTTPLALAAPVPQQPDLAQLFLRQFDGNGDGKVDIEEFLTPSRQQFKAMDTDGDGHVSGNEAAAFANMMRERAMQSAPPQR